CEGISSPEKSQEMPSRSCDETTWAEDDGLLLHDHSLHALLCGRSLLDRHLAKGVGEEQEHGRENRADSGEGCAQRESGADVTDGRPTTHLAGRVHLADQGNDRCA